MKLKILFNALKWRIMFLLAGKKFIIVERAQSTRYFDAVDLFQRAEWEAKIKDCIDGGDTEGARVWARILKAITKTDVQQNNGHTQDN